MENGSSFHAIIADALPAYFQKPIDPVVRNAELISQKEESWQASNYD
jgi:hypothetical protein